MTQLEDDCFAFGGALMPLAEALAILEARIAPVVDRQRVPLALAGNRVLAAELASPRDVPPHDNSAVDGYAVRFDDLAAAAETRLPVTARVAAGHALEGPARPGEAVRIFTGAPMPDGFDTVFMEEDVRLDGGLAILPPGLKRGANRRLAGEDVTRGAAIIAAGTRLRPQDIGLAASAGVTELEVFKPLRVALFSTGDEIREPGTPLAPGCVYDANRYMLCALLERAGCQVTDLGILADDAVAIKGALAEAAAGHDLLVTSGGVSLGEEDHVKAVVEDLGRIDFWRLAIKPGRPIALGHVGTTAFVGLPGNPVAAMVTYLIVGRPLIMGLGGRRDGALGRYSVAAGFSYKKKPGRREWLRVRLRDNGAGGLEAHKYRAGGAGILSSLAFADGLLELPEDMETLAPGDPALYLSLAEALS